MHSDDTRDFLALHAQRVLLQELEDHHNAGNQCRRIRHWTHGGALQQPGLTYLRTNAAQFIIGIYASGTALANGDGGKPFSCTIVGGPTAEELMLIHKNGTGA